jgi:FtsH-binding integral membrane protein
MIKSLGVLLPLAAFVVCWAALRRRRQGWREAFLASAILWGVWVVVTAEVLSVAALITPASVAGSWILALIFACALAVPTVRPSVPPLSLVLIRMTR